MKQTIRNLLPKNRFARSVSVLAGGTAVGQAIQVLASPVLTRLYTPDDFGILAVYGSLLMILGVVASLRYQLAIPVAKSEEESLHVVFLSLFVVAGMTLGTVLLVFFCGNQLGRALNIPGFADYVWLLPAGLFLVGTYQVFQYWAIRTKAFTAIARTKLIQALSMVGLQVGGYAFGPIALLMGQVFGQMAGTTSLGVLPFQKYRHMAKRIRPADIVRVAGRYRRFPLYSTWGAIFNTAGSQLPPLLFAVFYGASSAGIYLLAHRVLAIPVSIVGRAVADVFFFSAADANRQNALGPLVTNIHSNLAQFLMPPVLIIVWAGPDLFSVFFGKDWQLAGEFARWMAIYIYFQFITSPLSQLFSVLEKQAQGTLFQGILLILQVVGLFVGTVYESLVLSVALFSLGSALCYMGLLVWIVSVSGNKMSVVCFPTMSAFGWSVFLTAPFLLLHTVSNEAVVWFSGLFFSAVLIGGRYFYIARKSWQ